MFLARLSMPFYWEWKLALGILSDFPGIRNLSGLNDLNSLNNLSGLNDLCSLISSKTLLNLMFPSALTSKMTYPSHWMWDESSKIHFFIDFWHSSFWRLWRTKLKGHMSNFQYSGPQKAQNSKSRSHEEFKTYKLESGHPVGKGEGTI